MGENMRTLDKLVQDAILTGHSVCAPSKSAQWMNCPFSIAMEEWARVTHGAVDEENDAAKDGTAKHNYLNLLFQFDKGNISILPEIPEEHDEAVMVAYRAVMNIFSDAYLLESEMHLKIGDAIQKWYSDAPSLMIMNLCHGTSDVVALDFETRTLWIIDAKFGRIGVDPNSPQLKAYACGAYFWALQYMPDIDHIRLGIIQPPISHELQSCEVTLEELQQFAGELLVALGKVIELYSTQVSNGENCTPGVTQCTWCKANKWCRSYEEFLVGSPTDMEPPTAEALAEIGMAPPPELPENSTLAQAYSYWKDIQKWGEVIETTFKARLQEFDAPIDNWELKYLRKNAAKWVTGVEASDIASGLGVDIELITKLDTPSAVAKRLKGIDISEFVIEGEPVYGIARCKP